MTGPQRIHSPWVSGSALRIGPVVGHVWRRDVLDGTLVAIVAEEPEGWHLSISFRDHRHRLSRYPTWDEIRDARYDLLPADLDFVMHLPPPDEYVNVHATTFHLHEHPPRPTGPETAA